MVVNRLISLTEQLDWLRGATQHWRRAASVSNPGLFALLEWLFWFITFCLFCLNWLSRRVFGSSIRSNRDTTSHIKPSPSGCTALSPWSGPSKGFLIRRCPSTRPGSTRCSAQTAHHTSPYSLWVRPFFLVSVLTLLIWVVVEGSYDSNFSFFFFFFFS